MTLNLTLTALSISNLCQSPLFYTGKKQATFFNLNVFNSFPTSILATHSIYISNSRFQNFLSSAVQILLQRIQYQSETLIYKSKIESTLFHRCVASNNQKGGGIYDAISSPLEISNCLFVYCEAPEEGGAIYACSNNIFNVTIENTRTYFCTASKGSSFYINNAQQITLNQSSIEESAPSKRSGIESNCIIITSIDNIEYVNYTSCYSQLSSAALLIDCSESQTIRFATFKDCNGHNILCLKGMCESSNSYIEKIIMMNNNLNGVNNSVGNDPHEGNSLISIMGQWRISDSFFILDRPEYLASIGYGSVTFFRCTFNINLTKLNSISNIFLLESRYEANPIIYPPINFTVNDIVYSGPPYFRNETATINQIPPAAKFVLKNRLGFIISSILVVLIFLIVTILAYHYLKRHRRHVLVILHKTYAEEAQKRYEEQDIGSQINDKGLVIVVDENDKKKKEKEKRDLMNDFDDFYYITKKDNRFNFDQIEVPDTHLWDTDEGDVQVPNDDAFSDDVDGIFNQFETKEKSKKGKKKKKNKLSSLIKKGNKSKKEKKKEKK